MLFVLPGIKSNFYFCQMDQQLAGMDLEANKLSFDKFRDEVLRDFKFACISREISLLGRREVLNGKAKFGIFGDGKEVPQVAMAKFFKPGDFRSGYYRDQTFMLAAEILTPDHLFAQLYADPLLEHEPSSAGRQMNGHFGTKMVDEQGNWLKLTDLKNISSDISPTGGQMPRALGLAFASKSFRNIPALHDLQDLSVNGNEVCFCTIGDASTSEAHFWETINAAGVLQIPLAVFVWDDGYGISVPKEYQTTKGSVSDSLSGMQKTSTSNGINIYKIKGWDYAGMCEAFEEGIRIAREEHIPVLFHVEETTQPQGHSTSGSHERYKNSERLEWEKEWDGIRKMKEWILTNELGTEAEINEIVDAAKETAKKARHHAWEQFINPIRQLVAKVLEQIQAMAKAIPEKKIEFEKLSADLKEKANKIKGEAESAMEKGKEYFVNDMIAMIKIRFNSLFFIRCGVLSSLF